jgi:hypothetical protein
MNALENTDLLTQETLMHVVNELTLYKLCDRQWEDKFGKAGAQVGDSIRIRKPTNFEIREGEEWVPQGLVDPYINFGVDQQFGVDWYVTSKEKTLSLDRVSERYLMPQARRIANEIDLRIAREMARGAAQSVGTPGTAVITLSTYQTALSMLKNLGVPGPYHVMQTPDAQQAIVTELRGLFNPQKEISRQNLEGEMFKAVGATWATDNNLYVHTTGAATGSGLIKGADQSGAGLITDDWTASTVGILKKGDKISAAGAYAVNPITGAPLGFLRQFTVTADVDSDGSGEATVPIDPPIVLSGPYKNVSAAPTNDTGVLLFGHVSSYASKQTPLQLVFNKNACAVAVVGLDKPDAGEKSSYKADEDAGISMRLINWYDGKLDRICYRWDVLIGIKVQLPDFVITVATSS